MGMYGPDVSRRQPLMFWRPHHQQTAVRLQFGKTTHARIELSGDSRSKRPPAVRPQRRPRLGLDPWLIAASVSVSIPAAVDGMLTNSQRIVTAHQEGDHVRHLVDGGYSRFDSIQLNPASTHTNIEKVLGRWAAITGCLGSGRSLTSAPSTDRRIDRRQRAGRHVLKANPRTRAHSPNQPRIRS